ncbi:unnamed protein product [Toxocara canis]|uniref:PTP_tm domain-containing protein n=1 Tax=Toxocara canis TaxID=6265 RepID=A0A183V9X7_TOXCA|nr:unnamed protein product [Toxocara canis]
MSISHQGIPYIYFNLYCWVNLKIAYSYTGILKNGQQSSSTIETINRKKFRFAQLASDAYYTFTLTVIMGVGNQQVESEAEAVTVGISGLRLFSSFLFVIDAVVAWKEILGRSPPVLVRRGPRELTIAFENDQNTFMDTNGVIDNYAVIVGEDIQLDDDEYELRSWFDVRWHRRWPPYRASPSDYNPFRDTKIRSAKFVIGEDDCELHEQLHKQYCNGILRPNANYFAKVRAYTLSNIAVESGWISISDVESPGEENANEAKRLPCHFYLNGCPRKSEIEEDTEECESFELPVAFDEKLNSITVGPENDDKN